MATITLERFRLITGLSDSAIGSQEAIQAICAGSGVARRITGREFGHAIEFAEQIDATDVLLRIYRHQLPDTGSVYIQGTGISGLVGELEYTAIDQDHIRIEDVSVASRVVNKGVVCIQATNQYHVAEGVVVIEPGPVAAVSEVRLRRMTAMASGSGDPFDDDSVALATDWYIDTSKPNWRGELEIYAATQVWKRVRGMINPVKQKARREAKITYFAGCALGVPDDLMTAIAAISKEIAQDPSGVFQSENYDYYSYQRADPAMIAKLPTSAISVLFSYRLGR